MPTHRKHPENHQDIILFKNLVWQMKESLLQKYSAKPLGRPLILAALPEHQSLFHKVNKNPLLLTNGIAINPSSASPEKQANMAWETMEPEYNQKLDSLVAIFEQARANRKNKYRCHQGRSH